MSRIHVSDIHQVEPERAKEPAILSPEAYLRAVTLRDLTNPAQGPHAMQQVIDRIHTALTRRWGCALHVHRAHPAVPVEHNYDRLHYPPGGAARDARYTRYVSETTVLRSQTSAMIPWLLRQIAGHPPATCCSPVPAWSTAATRSTGCTRASRTRWTCGASCTGASASRSCGRWCRR